MEVEATEGGSVFLRGWGDYQRYSLKLTEPAQAGLGHMALRARSPEALERRVAAIEAEGRGEGMDRRRPWARSRLPVHRPDGHAMELYFETEKTTRRRRYGRR
jgi:catechol 2,3-dioxygenase